MFICAFSLFLLMFIGCLLLYGLLNERYGIDLSLFYTHDSRRFKYSSTSTVTNAIYIAIISIVMQTRF